MMRDPDVSLAGRESLIFATPVGRHLFVTDASRVYALPHSGERDLLDDYRRGLIDEQAMLLGLGVGEDASARMDHVPNETPLRALSLNIAQSCNLACSYCYADEGRFGGRARTMDEATAERAVDLLLETMPGNERALVGFMGGEPLLNRKLLHHVTGYAADAARRRNLRLGFSITTNGTLINDVDAALFRDHRFAVQLSLDGGSAANDAARPHRNGKGSFERVRAAIELIERVGHPAKLSARATVMAGVTDLVERVDDLIALGFDDVGVAPVLVSPRPEAAFTASDFTRFTEQMIFCGTTAKEALLSGRSYPFTNFIAALQEIHRGSHRPYSCGAGASYLSVNADGDLYACHRLVDDPSFKMGDLTSGVDAQRKFAHLSSTHVDRQEPCRSCWARYLCGGGCHHEVARRGRPSCDFIRAWLQFCLSAYVELLERAPQYFDGEARHDAA